MFQDLQLMIDAVVKIHQPFGLHRLKCHVVAIYPVNIMIQESNALNVMDQIRSFIDLKKHPLHLVLFSVYTVHLIILV